MAKKPNQLDAGFYTVGSLKQALKLLSDDLIVTVADCHMLLHEHDGKSTAMTRCRQLVAMRVGVFNHKRPIMNFTVPDSDSEEQPDAVCLFPAKSREVEECKFKESPSESGVSSKETSASEKVSTQSEAPTVRVKPTSSMLRSSRSRGTYRDFME